jgi:hypothetical protein
VVRSFLCAPVYCYIPFVILRRNIERRQGFAGYENDFTG